MSILIKGMDKPKTCGDCRFKWHGDSVTYCLALSKLHDLYTIKNVYYSIDDNCPLIEIPKPHGRLIDADEYLLMLGENVVGGIEAIEKGYGHDWLGGVHTAWRELDDALTILEAED